MGTHNQLKAQLIATVGSGAVTTDPIYIAAEGGILEWDPTKFKTIVAIYFEAVLLTTNAASNAYAQLANRTTGLPIANTEVITASTVWERLRSINLVSLMPPGKADLEAQIKSDGPPGECQLHVARLVIEVE